MKNKLSSNKHLKSWQVGRVLPVIKRSYSGADHGFMRRKILLETLHAFDTPYFNEMAVKASQRNIHRWSKLSESPQDLIVNVEANDWGACTQEYTKRYGEVFAVLNMANAYVPGGGYTHGTSAQEENMFRRTDCHFYIDDGIYDHKSDRYTKEFTNLLKARDGRVFLDKKSPRICIRGLENRSDPDLGYRWLRKKEIFSFYELRAAAQDLRRGREFSESEARKRISAQLDTLIDNQVRHAVLSAFGCGVFQNPADRIADIYKDEIEKRKFFFSVIVFAIFYAGYGTDNFTPFSDVFCD